MNPFRSLVNVIRLIVSGSWLPDNDVAKVAMVLLWGLLICSGLALLGEWTALVLWGVAAFSSGALLGFLFGIPLTSQGVGSHKTAVVSDTGANIEEHSADQVTYRPNTNLEEISEWLTKIIIGMGLVELTQIPSRFESLVRFLAADNHAPGIVGAVLVLFAILGFFAGYLLTRLFLSPTFKGVDTLVIGGQKLSVGQVSGQQRNLISDLQAQLIELRKKVGGAPSEKLFEAQPPPPSSKFILWVDENPKNNAYFFELLQKRGYQVETVSSTTEALDKAEKKTYRIILSNMRRKEGENAGIKLLGSLKDRSVQSPFVVFCSPESVHRYGTEVEDLGGHITSSPTDLRALLDRWAPGPPT
jgi:hypothetical protein